MAKHHIGWYNATVQELFTAAEIKMLMQKSDLKATYEIVHTWAWIVAAFALAYFFPHWLTYIIAVFILGGKQLACAIIMHDASHNALFTSKKVNTWVGNYLGAYPILQDVRKYAPYHLEHHRYTGTDDDPDVGLTVGYPTSFKSMCRKFVRDFLGASGIKGQAAILLMNFGYLEYSLGGRVNWLKQKRNLAQIIGSGLYNISGGIMVNVLLWGVLYLLGAAWLYWLWIIAWLTTYNFCLRVRSMAEHSMVDDRNNPLLNTRTTYANFVERLLFAPHHVNYHAEHHLLMGAPSYNYPKMHQLLKQRGYFDQAPLEKNYWSVLKRAIR